MQRAAPSAFPESRALSLPADLAGAELLLVEPRVEAASREQLVVEPALDDAASIHHEDEVGAKDRAQPVGYDEARPPGEQGRQRLLDQRLRA